jgi:hypothetical protein
MENISKFLKSSKRIGVFLGEELVAEYPLDYIGGISALRDAQSLSTETGIFHEVKIFDVEKD